MSRRFRWFPILAALLAYPLLGLPAQSDDVPRSWHPPEAFDLRPDPVPAERPQAGTPYIFALLNDELIGSNRENSPGPLNVKRPETVGAYVVNLGQEPWSGLLRLELLEAGVTVERTTTIPPLGIRAVTWVGYLELAATSLTARATALSGSVVADEYERTGDYDREWPLVYPVGVVVRDFGSVADPPAWLSPIPYAVSFLNTQPAGSAHLRLCDDVGCEHVYGGFFTGYFRWLNLAHEATGPVCLSGHNDVNLLLGPHDRWDQTICPAA